MDRNSKLKTQNSKPQLKIKNLCSRWKWTISIGLGIVVVFFLLRLINLTILPIFCDEAVYIRWAQVMKVEPSLRFLPLSVGSPPLFMWLIIPLFKFFADPLFAGRFLSVLCGFLSLVGIFLISYRLFTNKKLSLICLALYSVIPFFVFSERLALIDSMLTMFGIWLAYLGILLTDFLRLDLAMITGIVLGGAILTKSPALFFALLLPSSLLLSEWMGSKTKKKIWFKGVKVIGLWLIVYLFGFGIYNFLLRLGPNFQMVAIRNKDALFSFQEIFSHPLDPLMSHLRDLSEWLPNLLTLPFFGLSLLGILVGLRKKIKETLFLLIWSVAPLFIQVVLAKIFTPRYILFTIWPLIIFASFLLIELFNQLKCLVVNTKLKCVMLTGISILLFFPALNYDRLLLTNPEKVPLPRNLRSGHLEEWTAGIGIKEAAEYFKDQSKSKKVLVGTEGYFGTLPDGLQIYLERVPNITIIGIGLYPDKVPESLTSGLKDNEVYLLINNERLNLVPQQHNLLLIKSYPKASRPDGTQQDLLLLKLVQGNE